MKDSLGEKQADLNKVNQSSETLLQRVHEDSGDHVVIVDKVSELSSKYADLQDKLRVREEQLATEVGKANEFNDKVKELDDWLDGAKDQLANVGPISTDPEAVKKQLEDIEVGVIENVHQIIYILVYTKILILGNLSVKNSGLAQTARVIILVLFLYIFLKPIVTFRI
jgi:chromosome segregation ATPase